MKKLIYWYKYLTGTLISVKIPPALLKKFNEVKERRKKNRTAIMLYTFQEVGKMIAKSGQPPSEISFGEGNIPQELLEIEDVTRQELKDIWDEMYELDERLHPAMNLEIKDGYIVEDFDN